jgi:hypothetical protein
MIITSQKILIISVHSNLMKPITSNHQLLHLVIMYKEGNSNSGIGSSGGFSGLRSHLWSASILVQYIQLICLL